MPCSLRLAQDRLDAHRRILQIGPGLAFEFREPLQVEDVIGGAVVGEVGEFDGGDADLARDLGAFLGGIIGADALLRQPLLGFRRGHGDQVVQLHHAAGAGLERLAVGAVHGAVADMLQLRPCRTSRPSRAARNTCSKWPCWR